MTALTAELSPVQRLLELGRALVTPSAPLLEWRTDLIRQRNEWARENGRALIEQWHAVVESDGRVRYVFESDQRGESSWERPADAEIVAIFRVRQDARPIGSRIEAALVSLPIPSYSEEAQLLTNALDASELGHNERLVARLGDASDEPWMGAWVDGLPDLDLIEADLSARRDVLRLDGAGFGSIGVAITVIREVEDLASEGHGDNSKALRTVSVPLAEGLAGSPGDLVQATAQAAFAARHGQALINVFRRWTSHVLEGVEAALDSPDVNAFQFRIFEMMPVAIGSVELGHALETIGGWNDKTREKIADRLRVVDEVRVRLVDGVLTHVENLIQNDRAWYRHVEGVWAAGGTSSGRASERVARALIEQRYLYPRAMLPDLLAAAARCDSRIGC